MILKLTKDITVEHSPAHLHLEFSKPHDVVSSAVLNGGWCRADHIINMQVPVIEADDVIESPQETISKYCQHNQWAGVSVGMMTAASMKSFSFTEDTTQNVTTAVLLTIGLDNARRAGDTAEYRAMSSTVLEQGTINIIALTTAHLTAAAIIEATQIIAEAKTAVIQDLDIKSPVSGLTATGTGTDSLAFVNGEGPVEVQYCGKHMLFGEILAKLVMTALHSSLEFYQK
jgi:adenosylcobinamide hydrolase